MGGKRRREDRGRGRGGGVDGPKHDKRLRDDTKATRHTGGCIQRRRGGDVITEVRCGNAVWAGPSEEIAMEFAKRWIKYVEVA